MKFRVTVHVFCHSKKCGTTYEQQLDHYRNGYYNPPTICGVCGGRYITINNIKIEETP